AYMVQGFGGVFRKLSSQPRALMLGSLLVCILRFLCHVISGATVWAGLSIPTAAALVYSVSYNATYMIPETIVTCALAYYVGSILDFREENIGKMVRREKDRFPFAKWIAGLLLAAVVTFDVRNIFAYLQNAETGDFDITGLASVNWTLLGIVTLVCAGVAVCLLYVAKGKKEVA
ncbi:MAG: energy-coupled thiamine transporter ThiT, partial [Lachnospiraceae bacterium]|nr:energy-coupled thiamine transporter ThiT [Lachnospiraceae bacterium]